MRFERKPDVWVIVSWAADPFTLVMAKLEMNVFPRAAAELEPNVDVIGQRTVTVDV
jgi:hypothetical protein